MILFWCFMGSNPVLYGMCPAMKTSNLDGQVARHPAERRRPTGTGAGGQEVAGLARPRTRQDLVAAELAPAQSRGGQVVAPQYRDRARDLAVLGQRRHGRVLRHAPQRPARRASSTRRLSSACCNGRGKSF